ncbi:LuxR C-terminal-related transcriptional regulator [Streptomyces albipurpureus]|uniref:LuxR C-terminal-related transcriptional regulator n=1 Tax=Streptomyces albipurpureus TaxID=2897419 RepID=A0ABT0UYK5_9ACTN|nr:LuxR C-terminal-related transcriptional regulator [Streptomyces sp. CWNU-1]MCM2392725.1 LuxR C-terminal-related transcriptional regulator [Streptomyces sp. CWNU-1]
MPARIRHEDGLHTTQLTRKELAVLTHFAKGGMKREVAQALEIAEGTVSSHLGHIANKLVVSGLPAILHAAYTRNILKPAEPQSIETTEFSAAERRIWHAATESTYGALARAAGLSQQEAVGQLKTLMRRVGAVNRAHFVALGHAHGVLTPS